MVEDKNW